MAAAGARAGFRRLFSVSAFAPRLPRRPPRSGALQQPLRLSAMTAAVHYGGNKGTYAGLNKRTTSEGLMEAFLKFGQVIEARVITDRISGYSRGFGFVKYATVEEAGEGIKGMDGKFLDGWVIFAEYAKQRDAQQPPQPASSMAPPSGYQYSG